MGLKDSAKRAAASAAGIAVATSGLSTCNSGGGIVVDPAPPPLICTDVAAGQTLVPSARMDGSEVVASIRATGNIGQWQVTRVLELVGGAVTRASFPRSVSDSLVVVLQPTTPATTRIDFTVEAQLSGFQNQSCAVRRSFHVTIAPTGVQISMMNLDQLPLPARQRAEIAMVGRDGYTVSLEARTLYRGPHAVTWEVTGGTLDTTTSPRAQWTLPNEPGIYQAELLLDYGEDGVAFDALMLEVTG